MKKPKRPGRQRTMERKAERAHDKLAEMRARLALLEPGGTPELPLEVESASLVQPRAEALRCLRCDGRVRCAEHTALDHEGTLLRAVQLCCPVCGAERTVFVRIRQQRLN